MNNNGMFWNTNTPENNDDPITELSEAARFDSRGARKSFNIIGFGYALYAVASLTAALIIQVIAMMFDPDIIENTLFLNAITPVSLYVFALPWLFLVLLLCGAVSTPLEKKRMGFGKWLLILVVSFGLMYIGNFVGQGVMWGFTQVVGYDYSNALETMIDFDNMWITAIFLCVVAPIGEEFVFRKLLIDRTHKYGGFVSIFFSALLFGLMHANFYQFFYAFALGLVLGYVYYSTGNVWYGISLHATINFIGSVVTSYLDLGTTKMAKALETVDPDNLEELASFYWEYGLIFIAELAFIAFFVLSMISAIVLPIVFRKRIVWERNLPVPPRGKAFGAAFLNAGVIVLLLVYALEFVISLIPPAVG